MVMFGNLSDRLIETFKNLRSKGKLSPADIDATLREIRRALLEADVALEVVKNFTTAVRDRALGDEVSKALNPAQQVVQIVNEELVKILGSEQRKLSFAKTAPTVIMLAGLQGSGKTTLAGKLAKWLKNQGQTPILVAADLQRPNAVNQLQVVGERIGVPVFAPEPGNGVGNPVAVAKDSIKHAKQKMFSVVIVDTAGRLGIDEELMTQAKDIRKAVDPDEVLFVIDSMIGQDAVNVAKAFDEGVGITGVVLTKLDGDARGGAALSVASVTGKPILFASNGEGMDAFEPFYPDRMASRILDMGDVLTLIEQTQKNFDETEAKAMAEKLAKDTFTLEDFLDQMQQLKKMGSLKSMLAMMPGAGQMRNQLENFDEREIVRTEAIIRSMTPAERRQPKLLNGSRRSRIAKGSGMTVTDVNSLVNRFEQAAKMMKTVAKGGVPQMPGMPGMPGMGGGFMGGKSKSKGKDKKVSKSGNPAKRAAEEAAKALGQKPGDAPSSAGSSFGLGK
ncbi:MAG: signal recognition particle protein [Actinobacteria bacterium]|nr:signal recognition particle protein [Actinomycetota bacterium]